MTSTIIAPDWSVTGEPGRRGWRRKRVAAIAGAVLAAAAVGGGLAVTGGPSGPRQPTLASAAQTAAVERTDVTQTTPVDGTIGFTGAATITQPGGAPPATVTHDQQSVAGALQTLDADEQAAADTNHGNNQSVTQAEQALAAAQATLAGDAARLHNDQSALSAAEQKEASDCQGAVPAAGSSPAGSSGGAGGSSSCATDAATVANGQQTVTSDQPKVTTDQTTVQGDQGHVASAQQTTTQGSHQGDAKIAADQQALANAQATLAADQASATAYAPTSKYTTLPAVGQVIQPGQAIWSVDGRRVPLLPGTLTPWRAFMSGMTPGPDVTALDRALIQLGFGAGLTPSNAFIDETVAAIDRLQASLELPETGYLPLGSVVFAPGAVRVTAVRDQLGTSPAGGSLVMDVTSTVPIVNVALPVGDAHLVKEGDAVSVNLPDGTATTGTVTAIGTVATPGSQGSQGGQGSQGSSPTVAVTVTLLHASPTGILDQAPVTVTITNSSVHGVLAVPTTALLALAGGGYAVEVVGPDGTHHLVGVTTGIFDDQAGLVQIAGDVTVGEKVMVAA